MLVHKYTITVKIVYVDFHITLITVLLCWTAAVLFMLLLLVHLTIYKSKMSLFNFYYLTIDNSSLRKCVIINPNKTKAVLFGKSL